jgi:hypothetical protein
LFDLVAHALCGKSLPPEVFERLSTDQSRLRHTKTALIKNAARLHLEVEDIIDDEDATLDRISARAEKAIAVARGKLNVFAQNLDELKLVKEKLSSAQPTPEQVTEWRAKLAVNHELERELTDAYADCIDLQLCASADGRIQLIGLPRWADNGFPQIEIGQTFAAALLCTNIDEGALQEVRPPWNSFMIEIPGDLLEIWSPVENRNYPVRRILVMALRRGQTPDRRQGVSGRHVIPPAAPCPLREDIERKAPAPTCPLFARRRKEL